MSQFATALDLATLYNGTTDLDELEPEWIAQADALLVVISDDIEAAAGITIDAGDGIALLAGTWSRDLDLPAGPVRDITAVTVNGTGLASSEYFHNARSVIRRGMMAGDEIDDGSGRNWGGPGSTVAVAYGWGFETVPGFVRSLALRIAARTIGNVAQVTQESLAIYSVSYGASTNTNDGSHVTNAERKRLRHLLNRTGGTVTPSSR